VPWSKEHKRATRQRIVEAAAAAFRERGLSEVGVAELMRRADLTHGGFYAHFASKDDLVAETLPHAMAQAGKNLERLQRGAPNGLLATACAYLSLEHMEHPEQGCAIAALGPELGRGAPRVRQSLAKEIRKRLEQLDDLVPSKTSPAVRRQQSAGALACMVGGLILARGMKPSDDCRAFLRNALAEAGASK
jgi:TetR/AcrR family transcriptional repressor of nem operon